jgi:quercetin dioxygenase-like cupin family protein
MEVHRIENMVKGWFIGNFDPSLFKTNDVEVGLKEYLAGDYEAAHFHKIATEYTVIVSGEVEMNGIRYQKGSIIVIKPHESTDFKAITNVTTMVVKLPGANNDKYSLSDNQ